MNRTNFFILLIVGMGPLAMVGCAQESEEPVEPVSTAQQAQTGEAPMERVERTRPMINARALSLSEMTANASRIIQGRITNVVVSDVQLDDGTDSFSAEVQTVTIDVQDVIKGNVDTGSEITIRQYASLAQPIEEGEQVLWYLPEDSEIGLSAPLGVYSGHFKIMDDENEPGQQVVLNLAYNKGLWSGNSLWSDSGFSSEQFQTALFARYGSEEKMTRVIAFAARPNRTGPLPLELVTSASAAIIGDAE